MYEYETVEPDFETPEGERITSVDIEEGEITLEELREFGEQFDAELERMARGDPWWTEDLENE